MVPKSCAIYLAPLTNTARRPAVNPSSRSTPVGAGGVPSLRHRNPAQYPVPPWTVGRIFFRLSRVDFYSGTNRHFSACFSSEFSLFGCWTSIRTLILSSFILFFLEGLFLLDFFQGSRGETSVRAQTTQRHWISIIHGERVYKFLWVSSNFFWFELRAHIFGSFWFIAFGSLRVSFVVVVNVHFA